MKHMKKVLSLVLAMIMVLAMGIPVMAAEEGTKGTITIDNAIDGTEYKLYKIFDLESYNNAEGKEAYAYKVAEDSPWKDFVTGTGKGTGYVTVDAQGYVSWVNASDNAATAQEFGAAALEYAKANGIDPVKRAEAVGETVKFEELELGYYLVESGMDNAPLVSLDTTQPNVTMKEKNGEPTVDKEVKDGDNWGDTNTASVGDVVEYHTIIDVKANASNYVLHDKMSDGLTFKNDVTVKLITVGETEETNVADGNYKVATEELGDECDFHVIFNNDYLSTLNPGDTLIVYYTATINENAVIAGSGNINETKLDYGEDGKTEWDETKTYVYEFDVDKFTIREDKTQQLAGAVFTLSKNIDGTDPITFTEVEKTEDGETTTYKVDKESEVSEITTDETGKFKLTGLAAGTYYLTEITAPNGYNKLARPIEVQIIEGPEDAQGNRNCTIKYSMLDEKGNSAITADTGNAENNTVGVENKTGAELPSTGGIGTTIFYILGGILVVGAGIMLVVKKRMSSEK